MNSATKFWWFWSHLLKPCYEMATLHHAYIFIVWCRDCLFMCFLSDFDHLYFLCISTFLCTLDAMLILFHWVEFGSVGKDHSEYLIYKCTVGENKFVGHGLKGEGNFGRGRCSLIALASMWHQNGALKLSFCWPGE